MKKGKSKRFLAGLLAGVMLIGAAPIALASDTSQPFENDTNSDGTVTAHYRIPAIVTLSDGTLVAAADKRNRAWGAPDDCRDIDTRVAISTDNGASWTHSTVNDTGENAPTGDSYGSGTYIDPALATDGTNVYMLVDLFPGSTTQDNSSGQSKFTTGVTNPDGYLKLRSANNSSYSYYLKDGTIFDSSNNAVSGYTVDSSFNLLNSDNSKLCNLFDVNSYFMPEFTSYLVLRKSADGGKTWDAPVILNGQVRSASEKYYLAGPGQGLVTSKGTPKGNIVFPCYTLSGGIFVASLLYSTDNGNTWKRTASLSTSSSEGEVVELADGTLRYFMRHSGGKVLKYADAVWNETTGTYEWNALVTTNFPAYNDADLGALVYSKKTSDGKQVLLVSASNNSDGRYNGRVFAFTLDDSNNMTLVNTYEVNNSGFSYSCMTELADGDIGLLFENWDSGGITYEKLDIDDVTGGLEFDTTVTPDPEPSTSPEVTETKTDTATGVSAEVPAGYDIKVNKVENVSGITGKYVAYDITVTDANGDPYHGATKVALPITGLDPAKGLYGFVVNSDGTIDKASGEIVDGKFTFTAPHLSVVGVAEQDGISDYRETVSLTVGGDKAVDDLTGDHSSYDGQSVTDASGNEIATVKAKYTPGSSDPVKSEITSGNEYYISDGTNYLSVSGTSITNQTDSSKATKWTITSNGNGYTISTTINSSTYYLYRFGSYYASLTTSSSTAQTWQYSTNYGFYYTSGNSTYYISKYNNSGWVIYTSPNGSSYGCAYVDGVAEGTTTITFHGVYPGTTSVVVGSTRYQIEVVKAQKTVSVQLGKTVSYLDNSKSTAIDNSNPAAATAVLDTASGTITFTGLAKGTTTITTETTVYTVKVSDVPPASETSKVVSASGIKSDMSDYSSYDIIAAGAPVTGLMLSYSENGYGTTSFKIKCVDADGKDISGVTYTSSDTSVATVSADGTITPAKDGNCTVTVTYPDGSTTEIPVRVILGDTNNATSTYRRFTIYSDALYHSELYCAVASGENRDTSWTKLPAGYVIRVKLPYNVNSGIIFAAKPDDGYALTYMGHSFDGQTAADGRFNYIGRSGNTYASGSTYSSSTYYYYDYAKTGRESASSSRAPVFSDSTSFTGTNGIYPTADFETLLQDAVTKGLDAAFHYTKQSSDKSPCSIQFQIIADKLPTMEKKIVSVTDADTKTTTDYYKDMTIEQGDTINYEIVITTYKTHHATYGSSNYGTISYPSATLTDELVNMTNQRVDLPASSTTDLPSISDGENPEKDQTVTVKVSFKLSLENFDKVSVDGTLTNTANLEYTYDAQFSKGTAQDKADASAKCTITVPVYVVDFGLPVTLTGRNDVLGSLKITGGTSTNSKSITPTDSRDGIVYTPKDVFGAEADFVQLDLTENKHYAIRVIPASNVLYDGSFLTQESGSGTNWTQGNAATAQQSGDQNTLYGYDNTYAASIGKSLDSAWSADLTASGSTAITNFLTTSFYGTGFDLIGTTGPETGYVYVMLSNSAKTQNKLIIVDTSYMGGGILHQVPLVHLEKLDADTYTVNILGVYREETKGTSTNAATYGMYGGTTAMDSVYAALDQLYAAGYDFDDVEFVYFDEGSALAGMDNASAVYASNAASTMATTDTTRTLPGTTVTIDGFRVYRDSNNSAYIPSERDITYVNVLDAVDSSEALFTEFDDAYEFKGKDKYNSDGGPKYEIYLAQNQSVVLKTNLNAKTLVQVSARAVTGSSTTMNSTTTIASNTEMYYNVTVGTDGTIAIANTGDGMLALGNLKFKAGTETSKVTEQTLSIAAEMLRSYAAGPDQPEPDPTPVIPQPTPVFTPDRLTVGVKSFGLFRTKVNTVTITTSTDVVRLTVNGKELRPTNSLLVQMGLSRYYTYTLVDTAKKNETRSYEVIAYNADGVASKTRIAKG